eukprot:jgi/Astpho2/2992/Aster-x1108
MGVLAVDDAARAAAAACGTGSIIQGYSAYPICRRQVPVKVLDTSPDAPGQPSDPCSLNSVSEAEAASRRFELQQYLDEQLLPDIQALSESYHSKQTDLRSYEQLQTSIRSLQQERLKSLECLVDLGHGVQMQASVQDASQITINVGLGFWAVCTLDEAPQVIAVKEQALQQQLASLDNDMAHVRAHMKLVQEGLEHLPAG